MNIIIVMTEEGADLKEEAEAAIEGAAEKEGIEETRTILKYAGMKSGNDFHVCRLKNSERFAFPYFSN